MRVSYNRRVLYKAVRRSILKFKQYSFFFLHSIPAFTNDTTPTPTNARRGDHPERRGQGVSVADHAAASQSQQ
jgi:hypothetical protein